MQAITTNTRRRVFVFVFFPVVMVCDLLTMLSIRTVVDRSGGMLAMAGVLLPAHTLRWRFTYYSTQCTG